MKTEYTPADFLALYSRHVTLDRITDAPAPEDLTREDLAEMVAEYDRRMSQRCRRRPFFCALVVVQDWVEDWLYKHGF